MARDIALRNERYERQAGRQGGHQNRRQALEGAAERQLRTELLAFVILEMLIMIDQHDLVAGGDSKDSQEADERSQRNDVAGDEGGQHPADQRRGQRQEAEYRQAPVSERCEQDHDRNSVDNPKSYAEASAICDD